MKQRTLRLVESMVWVTLICRRTMERLDKLEKLIQELQSQTDNPEVKEEIRKLIENGEWDKL